MMEQNRKQFWMTLDFVQNDELSRVTGEVNPESSGFAKSEEPQRGMRTTAGPMIQPATAEISLNATTKAMIFAMKAEPTIPLMGS